MPTLQVMPSERPISIFAKKDPVVTVVKAPVAAVGVAPAGQQKNVREIGKTPLSTTRRPAAHVPRDTPARGRG